MRHALCTLRIMKVDILISGFGGQGVISLGKILAKIALKMDKHIVGFPSYGAEMRGGTAHCFVKISDSPIASPFVEHPDIAVILNQPSLDKFKKKFKKGSTVILNSDLISNEVSGKGIKKISLALNKIALECGDIKVANIVVLGVLTRLNPNFLKKDVAVEILREMFGYKGILDKNLKAFHKGEVLGTKEKRDYVKS